MIGVSGRSWAVRCFREDQKLRFTLMKATACSILMAGVFSYREKEEKLRGCRGGSRVPGFGWTLRLAPGAPRRPKLTAFGRGDKVA